MSSDSDRAFDYWLLLPDPVRRLPADLAAVVAVVILTDLVVLIPGVNQTVLRVVAVPFVLFAPGYAFVSALFPGAPDTASDGQHATGQRGTGQHGTSKPRLRTLGIEGAIERIAFSFGSSIVIVAFLGLGLALTPWGVRLAPALLAISGVTLLTTAVAASRRWVLPPDERFSVSADRWLSKIRTTFSEPESRADAAMNVVLAASLLLATASVAYAVAIPRQGEAYTEFYLLSENETGNLVAADYPATFAPNDTNSVHVGVTNREHRQMEYVVVAAIQRVTGGNDTMRVREQRELTRVRTSLGPNETWVRELNVTHELQGERLRLVVLLYRGDAPATVSTGTAYRELRLLEDAPERANASAATARRRPVGPA